MKTFRLPGLLAVFAMLAVFVTLPAHAEDYDTVLDGLGRLQSLAESYAAESGDDPIELTLSYTRGGTYTSKIWSMVGGARDADFANLADSEGLTYLVNLSSVETPCGSVDFGHMLASINLVYRGLPIAGGWGGDCMELARQHLGNASDADGYVSLMAGSFDSSDSMFGGDDLRADLDSVVIGAQLTEGASLAETIRSYYSSITEYDRAYQFIALSFGDVNTGDSEAFRQTVYETLTRDTGMQLLLYVNGMMSVADGWTITADAAPALQGASYVFADYLAGAVDGARVSGSGDTRMVTMAVQALADALAGIGDSDAASAVLNSQDSSSGSSSASSGSVSEVFSGAASSIQSGFDLQIYETVLLILGAVALLVLLLSIVMLIRRR